MTNPNDPAQPGFSYTPGNGQCRRSYDGGDLEAHVPGLTKREHFAALAMQGFCASSAGSSQSAEMIAAWCIEQADALIAALNR